MAHRLSRVDPEKTTADCEECGPGVRVRLQRMASRPNPSWRCAKSARHAPGTKQRQFHKRWLKQAYDLTPEQYDAMVLAQEGRCAICDRATPLVVDHCHATVKVRKLLCSGCNTGLGLFREDSKALRAAADYMDAHR